MKNAFIFRNDVLIPVSADDVKNGKYNRNEEFVDKEYEFKVCLLGSVSLVENDTVCANISCSRRMVV